MSTDWWFGCLIGLIVGFVWMEVSVGVGIVIGTIIHRCGRTPTPEQKSGRNK